MGVYLDDFPGALEPRRTPFDDAGAPGSPCVFIYMTNRYEGRWSYLMAPGFEKIHDPYGRIGFGYTQLWIMQKMFCAHPIGKSKKVRGAHALSVPSFEEGVVRDDFDALFHVFREPRTDLRNHNDHIGGRRQLDAAVQFAKDYSNQERCKALVAKLLFDWQWH